LPFLQTQLNNNLNIAIELLSTKMIYDFKIKKALLLLYNCFVEFIIDDFSNRCLKYDVEVSEIIAFANAKTKIYYNVRHVFFIIKSNEKAYLKLNHKYQLFYKLNKFFFSQRCDSFLIKCRIERLAYELKLSFNRQIYFIIIVTQLKSYFAKDFYERSRLNYFNFVKMKDNISR